MRFLIRHAFIGVLGFVLTPNVYAGLAMSATRIVLTEDQPEQTLLLSNGYSYPILLQAWTGGGSPYSTPDTDRSPVITLPPVFKLNPGDERRVRLIFDGSDIPPKTESVYWLNLYEVPALRKDQLDDDAVRLQIATRTQLKVFVRPAGVTASDEEVAGSLDFKVIRIHEKWVLIATNKSPLHASFSGFMLEIDGDRYDISEAQGRMLSPGASVDYPITFSGDGFDDGTLTYGLINDQGQSVEHTVSLTHAANRESE